MSEIAGRRAPGNRRFALALAGLFTLAVLAAGCGGGDSSTTTTATAPRQSSAETIREFGHEANRSQAKQVEATLHGYMDARVAGEWKKACTYLAKPIRNLFDRIGKRSKEARDSGKGSQVTTKGCAGFVEEATRKLTPSQRANLGKFDVTSVRVEDDRGYILYTDSGGTEYSMSLKLEGGMWKLLGLSAAQLP